MNLKQALETELIEMTKLLPSHRNSHKDYYHTLLSMEKIVLLLDTIKDEEVSVESENTLSTNEDDYPVKLTKRQALIILSCLGHAIFKVDEGLIKNFSDTSRLIYLSDDVQWDIAEQLDIDLNDEYVDYHTLELMKV